LAGFAEIQKVCHDAEVGYVSELIMVYRHIARPKSNLSECRLMALSRLADR
jgi:hypothetical protein